MVQHTTRRSHDHIHAVAKRAQLGWIRGKRKAEGDTETEEDTAKKPKTAKAGRQPSHDAPDEARVQTVVEMLARKGWLAAIVNDDSLDTDESVWAVVDRVLSSEAVLSSLPEECFTHKPFTGAAAP